MKRDSRVEHSVAAAAEAAERASPLQLELARQIVERMRDEAWVPGMRISEQALARTLGVSRSPIRGALDLLVAQAVLEAGAGRGFVVLRLPGDAEMSRLIPRSEGEEVYTAIMTDRANGRLPQEVSEAELIPRYGVSRGVVRKVLMRFAAEGLVQRQRGHGWRFVDSLETDEAVAESYQFRMVVECAALRQPGFRLDRDRLQQLRRAHEDILARAAGGVGTEEWFRVNTAFHEMLAACSGNRFFLQAVRQQNSLRRMQEYADFVQLPQGRVEQSCREHLAILAALDAGDTEWAAALLHRHLALAAGTYAGEAMDGKTRPELSA
jgi:DNA-binding GntR family transcriptional regulator